MNEPPDHNAIRERTEAWLASRDLVGMSEEDLVAAASEHEVLVRVVIRDGKSLPSRTDRRPNRVNIEVSDGIVTGIDHVG